MECANHPGVPAQATCVSCGKPGCEQCVEQVAGHPMCKPCVAAAQEMIANPTLSAPPAAPSIAPAAGIPAPYPVNPPGQTVDLESEPAGPAQYLKGILFGLAAAVVGAFLWAKLTELINSQWGFMAIFLGMGIAIALKIGAENRRGVLLPVIGVLLCAFGVILGNIMIVWDASNADAEASAIPVMVRLPVIIGLTVTHMSIMDWVFVAIAMWEGWSIPRQGHDG